MSKNIKFLSVAILVIAIGGSYLFPQIPQTVLGAVPTLDAVDFPFWKINGFKRWSGTIGMTATSSIVCSFQNPYTATTSIVALSAEVTARGGLTLAHGFYVSTSTDSYASSSPNLIDGFPMSTGQFSVELEKNSATTTDVTQSPANVPTTLLPGRTVTGATSYVLGPSEYINFEVGTATPSTLTSYMTGNCSVELKKI